MAAFNPVLYKFVFRIPKIGRVVRVPTEVPMLDVTGEGITPLTTRLGGITLGFNCDDELMAAISTVSDYAEIKGELHDATNGKVIYAGVGDRKGWSVELTGRGRKLTATFCSAFESAGDVDIEDSGSLRSGYLTGRPYDTIPWSDAALLCAKAVGIKISATFPKLDLNGYSVIRKVSPRLVGEAETGGELTKAVAVLSDGGLAVGSGRYILLFNEGVWYGGRKVWYQNTGHAFDNEVAAGEWQVIALGYRAGDGKVHGLIGIPTGVVARFSFTPEYKAAPEALMITGADCFRWFWRYAKTQAKFTQWRSYNGTGEPEGFKDIYAIGYPRPDTNKDVGGLMPQARATGALYSIAPTGATAFRVTLTTPVAAGDRVFTNDGDSAEFLGEVKRIERLAQYQVVHTDRASYFTHAAGVGLYIYAASTWPTQNVLLPRPMSVAFEYVDAQTEGGNPKTEIAAIHHRGPGGGDGSYFRPAAAEDASAAELDPGYKAFQADTEFQEQGDRYFNERPRQFWAYVPGRCDLPPDVASGWEWRQNRPGTTIDQGDVTFYYNGAAAERGYSMGRATIVGNYAIAERMPYRNEYPGKYYYSALIISKRDSAGSFNKIWQSRADDNATSGAELYLTSQAVDVGGYLYFGALERTRLWLTLDAPVVWAADAQVEAPEAKGAAAVMCKHYFSDKVEEGAWVSFGGGEVFLVLEVAEVWRDVGGYNGPGTVLTLWAPQFKTAQEISDYFYGKHLSVSVGWQRKAVIVRFDKGTNTATTHPVKYNPGRPKIDEVATFAEKETYGEDITQGDVETTPAYAIFKAKNKYPASATAQVYVDGLAFVVENITDAGYLPAPLAGRARVHYRAGDKRNELWIYLAAEYKDSTVIVAYDYHPEVTVTAVWSWKGEVYYATSDDYLWKWAPTAESIGKAPKGDAPIYVTASGADTVYFATARGSVAQFGRYHSGAVEGDFGGKSMRAFSLLAAIARAARVRVRELSGAFLVGPSAGGEVTGAQFKVLRDSYPVEYRAVSLRYEGGTILVGDYSAPKEATAEVDCTSAIYTPQHAAVIAQVVLDYIQARRETVEITGWHDNPFAILEAATVRPYPKGSHYEIIGARVEQNRFTLMTRRIAREYESERVDYGRAVMS